VPVQPPDGLFNLSPGWCFDLLRSPTPWRLRIDRHVHVLDDVMRGAAHGRHPLPVKRFPQFDQPVVDPPMFLRPSGHLDEGGVQAEVFAAEVASFFQPVRVHEPGTGILWGIQDGSEEFGIAAHVQPTFWRGTISRFSRPTPSTAPPRSGPPPSNLPR